MHSIERPRCPAGFTCPSADAGTLSAARPSSGFTRYIGVCSLEKQPHVTPSNLVIFARTPSNSGCAGTSCSTAGVPTVGT